MKSIVIDLHGRKGYNLRKAAVIAAVLLAALLLMLLVRRAGTLRNAWSGSSAPILIIDPGHGGIDGGAMGADGTKESDINLAIALKLRSFAELFGEKCIMTRTNDSSLSDSEKYSEHEDLVLRAGIAAATPGAVMISIHQNCYITPQPAGFQILFSAWNGSEQLGKRIQENFVQYLEPNSRRLAEPAPKKLFLTANAGCPCVLVECGFMSNPYDLAKLKNRDYQTGLAASLFAAYTNFLQT